ncbi:MAG: glycoside hydrolase family 32 protein [Cyclobacteriaceae bacterium]|nr:glycoside hydrolase family 32 protein [Cyclobacteriaceae bacterium]
MKINYLYILLVVVFACKMEKKDHENIITIPEQHRPLFHFTPPSGWMNDPNGMVYHNGTYHLFYQHNPDDIVWGPMHWGHATSSDLIHWEHRPIALYPDEHGTIFSGSAVVDHHNTSGLGSTENPPIVAIFTYHNAEKAANGEIDHQTQGIAFSTDDGKSWAKYKGNPVLENPGIADFRDPKVFWHEKTSAWIMILAVQDHIRIYRSPNLIDWEYASSFGEKAGAHGGVWECPDLFELAVENDEGNSKWVLLLSINPGGPNGGSATQYFTGGFDGYQFTNDHPDDMIQWLDYGRDNYAGVSWSDIPREDGRRIFIGWMSNWLYANKVPTEQWRSAMTLARKMTLRKTAHGLRLISEPVVEFEKLRVNTLNLATREIAGGFNLSATYGLFLTHFEADLHFELQENDSDISIIFSNTMGESLSFGFNAADEFFYVDRSNAGKADFSDQFSGKAIAPYALNGKKLNIRCILDVSSIEMFGQNGECVMTEIFFPSEPFTILRIEIEGKPVELKEGQIFALKPAIVSQ